MQLTVRPKYNVLVVAGTSSLKDAKDMQKINMQCGQKPGAFWKKEAPGILWKDWDPQKL